MRQYMTISDLKDKAKEHLSGRFSSAIFANMIPGLFTVAVTFTLSTFFSIVTAFISMFSQSMSSQILAVTGTGVGASVLSYLTVQATSVITGIFNTGLALYFLNIACGRTANYSNLFYGFHYLFKKSLIISAVMTLINTVCFMPYNIFYALYQSDGSTKWLINTVISMGIGLLIYLPLSLNFSQCYYLLLDFPKYSAGQVLRLSVRLMKGRKWRLFLLQLSFVPLLLLGLLSLGIGDLWITPFMNMTMVLFFLDIMKSPSRQDS